MTAFIDTLEAPTAGKAGHIAASTAGWLGESLVRIVDAGINSALAVCNGATPGNTVKAPTTKAEAEACLGVLIDPEFLNDVNSVTEYTTGQQATLLQKGYIWVNAEGTVAVDDPVFVRFASDGGSNTTKGTMRNDNDTPSTGIVITPAASPVAQVTGFLVRLRDAAGHDETFVFNSDSSPSTAEVAAGLVALIDASANFAATGTTTITVTTQAGTGMVEVLALSSQLTLTTAPRAARLKGARFASAVTGAGLAKVRLQLRQDF